MLIKCSKCGETEFFRYASDIVKLDMDEQGNVTDVLDDEHTVDYDYQCSYCGKFLEV